MKTDTARRIRDGIELGNTWALLGSREVPATRAASSCFSPANPYLWISHRAFMRSFHQFVNKENAEAMIKNEEDTRVLVRALATLVAMKSVTTPGPWRLTYGQHVTHAIYGEVPGSEVVGATPKFGGLWSAEDGKLIVALHRTIEAQIAILKSALGDAEGSHDEPAAFAQAVELAQAIIKETP